MESGVVDPQLRLSWDNYHAPIFSLISYKIRISDGKVGLFSQIYHSSFWAWIVTELSRVQQNWSTRNLDKAHDALEVRNRVSTHWHLSNRRIDAYCRTETSLADSTEI